MSDARAAGGASAWDDGAAPPPPDDGSLTLDCGCATGCTCGCMDWTDLEALGPILEAAPNHGAAAGPALDVAPLLPSLFGRPPAPPPPPPAGLLVAAGGTVEGPPRPGSTGGGAASGAAGGAVMQQPPPATVPPPGATSARTRCLNDTHPPNCARCIPPPPPDEDCELVGDVGKKARGGIDDRGGHIRFAPLCFRTPRSVFVAPDARLSSSPQNGEKLLRSGLTSSPEWRNAASRRAASASAAASGFPRLAAALRDKTSAMLRKSDVLQLCRMWGAPTRALQTPLFKHLNLRLSTRL